MGSVQGAAWLLVVGLAGLLQACGAESDLDQDEPLSQAQEGLGSEDPYAGLLPMPQEPWSVPAPGSGAPATDPYRAARQAKQREYDRIAAENGCHGSGAWTTSNDRFYNEVPIPAPPAPRWTLGPLDDKGRCMERCFERFDDDMSYCARLPEDMRRRCREKASEDYSLCVRECSRKYPDPRLPKDD